LTILGIETSCDETAAAVVRRAPGGEGEILSNVILSQTRDHAPYGGVVPEIASRAHIEHLDRQVEQALHQSGLELARMDGIAATAGPGLIGGLMVGLTFAKALALATGRPLLAVNHLEAHALTPRLLGRLDFPYLLLLISGGHTQFQIVEGVGRYRRIGTTIDDALGEAFDKTAKLLGLGYPGGPRVEAAAARGDASRFSFPVPLKGRPDCNFSFSGLKTSVRELVRSLETLSAQDVADICAGFELAVSETLRDRLAQAFRLFRERAPDHPAPALVVAGGVAANRSLRRVLELMTAQHGFSLRIPPADLCTDNAAMVAWAGAERLALGLTDGLDFAARPRWPLDRDAAPAVGAGRLGAKV
jgi:N6-L-threonylcarbamoyladenine synthase